jgi:hypothetical protein
MSKNTCFLNNVLKTSVGCIEVVVLAFVEDDISASENVGTIDFRALNAKDIGALESPKTRTVSDEISDINFGAKLAIEAEIFSFFLC